MKKMILQTILILCLTECAKSQVVKSLNPIDQINFFKQIKGRYTNTTVYMGSVQGTGYVTFGFMDPFDFSFNISVLGHSDHQLGKMTKTTIETSNFESYTIMIHWENNYKNQGTPDGEIKINYNSNSNKHNTWFLGYNWQIAFNSEFDESQTEALNKILAKTFNKTPQYFAYIQKKKTQDSLITVRYNEMLRQAKINDSIQLVKKRITDSIQLVKKRYDDSVYYVKKRVDDSIRSIELIIERERLEKERRIQDSLSIIQKKLDLIKERKISLRQKSRLNYWGLGISSNSIQKNQSLLNNNAWKYITNTKFAVDGKPIDGSALGYNFFISRYLVSFLGLEFLWSKYTDGSYKTTSEITYSGTQNTLTHAILKNTNYGLGPVITLPISTFNFDFKYIYLFSRGVFTDASTTQIKKYTSSTKANLISTGIRLPIGKGEVLDNRMFSRGYLGLFYEIYKSNYKYSFGELPAYQTSLNIRYVNTIN